MVALKDLSLSDSAGGSLFGRLYSWYRAGHLEMGGYRPFYTRGKGRPTYLPAARRLSSGRAWTCYITSLRLISSPLMAQATACCHRAQEALLISSRVGEASVCLLCAFCILSGKHQATSFYLGGGEQSIRKRYLASYKYVSGRAGIGILRRVATQAYVRSDGRSEMASTADWTHTRR